MRRTGNTSVSPTMGIVLTPTGKMVFGPACAAAGPLCVAAPASAHAPVARIVLRSTVSMGRSLLVCFCYSTAYLAPCATRGKQFRIGRYGLRLPTTRERSRPSCCSAMNRSQVRRFQSKRPARARAFAFWFCAGRSVLDLRRQLAAVGGKLDHDLLLQPDVHGGGIIAVAGVAELLRELLARGEAGIDIERLHQVDDRGAPFQLFALGGNRLVEDGRDVDGCRGRSRSG